MSLDGDLITIGDALQVLADNAIMGYLEVQFPWINIPIVRWFVKIFINYFVSILVTKTEFLVYIMAVTEKVDQQSQDFKTAVQNNQEMLTHGTPEQQAKARQDLMDAAAAFISLRAP